MLDRPRPTGCFSQMRPIIARSNEAVVKAGNRALGFTKRAVGINIIVGSRTFSIEGG